MAIVTSLTVVHQGGLSFVHWNNNGIAGPFDVYSHTSQITSGTIGSATLRRSGVTASSGVFPYDDSASLNLAAGLKVPNGSGGLTTLDSSHGLAVLTPATSATRFYAVTHSGDATITVGTNSLSAGVAETAVSYEAIECQVLAAVTAPNGRTGFTRYDCMRWSNSEEWDHPTWPYYGRRFNVMMKDGLTNNPMICDLHAAQSGVYLDPPGDGPTYFATDYFTNGGVCVSPRDLNLGSGHENWFGAYGPVAGTIHNDAERDIYGMFTWVRDNPTFAVNPNRVYVQGGSMGGCGSFHMPMRYPAFFAATVPIIGAIDGAMITNSLMNPIVLDALVNDTATTFEEFYDASLSALQAAVLPPFIHLFSNTDDTWGRSTAATSVAAFKAAMTSMRRTYMAIWDDADHGIPPSPPSSLSDAWFFKRFQRNEATPAFYSASDDATYDVAGTDRRSWHEYFDWGSGLHTIGGQALTDTATLFTLPLGRVSGAGDATAGVCIWNLQTFPHIAGRVINWTLKAGHSGSGATLAGGTATVGSLGQIDVGSFAIPESGAQLQLTPSPLRIPWARA